MEQRMYVTVPGLPTPAAAGEWSGGVEPWEPFLAWLEEHHGDLGPILTGSEGGSEVVVSGDFPDRAAAAQAAVAVVAEALRATGFSDLFPSAVDIEPVATEELEPA
jgi:hypothetical protein